MAAASGQAELPPSIASRIDKQAEGCWVWVGSRTADGYGRAWHAGRDWGAHRLVYTLLVGPIPEGLHLDHVGARGCTSKACVNPAHLEPVTQAENNRRSGSRQAHKTHCPRGHEYSGANLYVHRGNRYCRACHRESDRARARRR